MKRRHNYTTYLSTKANEKDQTLRRVWRYQRGNQNPYIEEEQTTQWPEEEEQTTQWPEEEEQTTQWPEEEEQTTKWPEEKVQKYKNNDQQNIHLKLKIE